MMSDIIEFFLGSSVVLQIISLGVLVQKKNFDKTCHWLLLGTIISTLALFGTDIANPLFQSAYTGATFTASIIAFIAIVRGEN